MKKPVFLSALLFTSLVSFSQGPTSQGLVGYWPFTGNANDESGNNNNGTVTGATLTTDRFGRADNAYSFDGNDRISIPTSPALDVRGDITLSLWVKASSFASTGHMQFFIRGDMQSGFDSYLLYVDAGQVYLRRDVGTTTSSTNQVGTSISNLKLNEYNHVVGTIDQATSAMSLYVNNVLVAQQTKPGSIGYQTANFTNVVGAVMDGTQPFVGQIDDIRVYNRALNASEIFDLYYENRCIEKITVTDVLRIQTLVLGTISKQLFQTDIQIYPNPAKDYIVVDYGDYAKLEGFSLKITDAKSVTVFNDAITQKQSQINLSSLNGTGLYLVHLLDAGGSIVDVKKIIVE